MVANCLRDHPGGRLSAIALARVAGNLSIRMMRAIVNTGQWCSRFGEALAHPGGDIVKSAFVEIAMGDPCLVGYHDQLIACGMQGTACLQDARNEMKILDPVDVPSILIYHTVSVQECGRHAAVGSHGQLNSRRARSKSSGTPISMKYCRAVKP